MISRNIAVIKERIEIAAKKSKRSPDDITLVCVTKNRSLEEIKEALNCGIRDLGENKVQEAKEKIQSLNSKPSTLNSVKWHMIGHLQTNKVKDVVKLFDLVHSVDSLRLANEIDSQAAKINKVQDILIEANMSGEESKFGIAPDKVLNLAKDIVLLKNIRLLGLMTMAPVVEDKELARPYFKKLRQLQSEINNFLLTVDCGPLTILSMGMTQDYEVAIEEGATMVRIGTAIFEE